MTQEKTVPARDRIATSFKQLATVSADLNSAANELNKTIAHLEQALSTLNLGVSAWHQVAGDEDEAGSYWSRDIGYARVRNRWCIAIRRTWGDYNHDDHNDEEWPFAEAPRWMAIESVGKLPELFEDLIKRTEEATQKIKAKTGEARELAAIVRVIASGISPKAGKTR
jgi:hypothetical protein